MRGLESRKEAMFELEQEVFNLQDRYLASSNAKTKNSNKDMVTKGDSEIESLIRDKIQKLFSDDTIVSEEFDNQEGSSGYTWYIDGIDGTLNYSRGIRHFGTSIGLVYEKEIVFGVIFCGEDKKKYWAVKGEGAFCNDEKLKGVSKVSGMNQVFFEFDIWYDEIKSKPVFDLVKNIYPHIRIFRYGGSGGIIPLLRVARGEIDAYWSPGCWKTYDFCAAFLIVLESGGKITDKDGESFDPFSSKQIFATNGILHDEFVKLINDNYEGS